MPCCNSFAAAESVSPNLIFKLVPSFSKLCPPASFTKPSVNPGIAIGAKGVATAPIILAEESPGATDSATPAPAPERTANVLSKPAFANGFFAA